MVVPAQAPVRRALELLDVLGEDARMVWAHDGGRRVPGRRRPRRAVARAPASRARPVTITDEQRPRALGAATRRSSSRRGRSTRRSRPPSACGATLAELDVTRGDHVRAVGGGVVGDLAGFCRGDLPARRAGRAGADDASSPRSTRRSAARPASTCRRARTTSAPTTSRWRCSSDLDTLETLPDAERAAGYAEVVKTALIAGGRLWERVSAGAPVDADIVFACARTKVSRRRRRRARRRAAAGAQPRPHRRRTRWRPSRATRGCATARRSALGLLAALRLSGQDALRAQVRDLLAARRPAGDVRRVRHRRGRRGDEARQEAHRRATCRSC